jgi:hypothetical protein
MNLACDRCAQPAALARKGEPREHLREPQSSLLGWLGIFFYVKAWGHHRKARAVEERIRRETKVRA